MCRAGSDMLLGSNRSSRITIGKSPAMADQPLAEALMASLADAVYFVDAAGEVSFVNPAAVAVLGYDDERELLGCDSHATIHSHHRDGRPFPADDCPLLRPRQTGETV